MTTTLFTIALFMFAALILGICFAAAGEPVPHPHLSSTFRLMKAIAAVENTPRDKIGLSGERSEYQLTERVWHTHSLKPFEWASRSSPECVQETREVVSRELARIERLLSERRPDRMSDYAVFLIYKAGWRRVEEDKARPEDVAYAMRCLNVLHDLSHYRASGHPTFQN